MTRVEKARAILIAWMIAGSIAGCSLYQPYEYHDEREEMQGPGLFSGEDGVFTIYGKKKDPEEGKQAADKTDDVENNGREEKRKAP